MQLPEITTYFETKHPFHPDSIKSISYRENIFDYDYEDKAVNCFLYDDWGFPFLIIKAARPDMSNYTPRFDCEDIYDGYNLEFDDDGNIIEEDYSDYVF